MAAAPFQVRRGRVSGERMMLERSDLREKVRERKTGNLIVFVVDASASMDAEQPQRSERAVAPAPSDRPATNDHPEGLDYSRLYEYRFKDVDQDARQRVWNEIARYLWERMGRPSCAAG